MRINKFIAQATGLSRRAADAAVAAGKVQVNDRPAALGQEVTDSDRVVFAGQPLQRNRAPLLTVMLHKPVGYVVSRNGQGSPTIYDLLPTAYQHLQPVGRLDKDSSGLLLLTNDGQLANALTHPSQQKLKVYQATLDRPLADTDRQRIKQGIHLEDGVSRLQLDPITGQDKRHWTVTMHEGRNRQIRRTFAVLQYDVITLHRTSFGAYSLAGLPLGSVQVVAGNGAKSISSP